MDKRITNITLRALLRSFFDLLMPRVCAVCGRQLLPQEEHLCLVCEAGLPLTRFEELRHNPMADKFNALVEAPRYERASALFYYIGDYKRITQALKYSRNFALGRWAARSLGSRLASSSLWHDIDLVCPVPLHWTRRWTRGYNQASIIAREVARELNHARVAGVESKRVGKSQRQNSEVLFVPNLLRRTRRTDTQTRLASQARSANVSGAFAVNPRYLNYAIPALREDNVEPVSSSSPGQNGLSPLKSVCEDNETAVSSSSPGQNGLSRLKSAREDNETVVSSSSPGQNNHQRPLSILIIDDVFTTGATLAACHAALRVAFGPSVRISVATLAFVE